MNKNKWETTYFFIIQYINNKTKLENLLVWFCVFTLKGNKIYLLKDDNGVEKDKTLNYV